MQKAKTNQGIKSKKRISHNSLWDDMREVS